MVQQLCAANDYCLLPNSTLPTPQDLYELDNGTSKHLSQLKFQPSEKRRSVGCRNPQGSSTTATSTGISHGHTPFSFLYKLWALLLLSATYVHQAATMASIPVMLPMIAASLTLSDLQGALLTSGYSYFYAIGMIPFGLLADKVNRPMLLGAGIAVWSTLTFTAGHAHSFTQLFATRIGVATAQSMQNIICFSMIPGFFPKNKSTALAFYNMALYIGRGLMFLIYNAARTPPQRQQVVNANTTAASAITAYDNMYTPMSNLNLTLVELVYTSTDMVSTAAPSLFHSPSMQAEAVTEGHASVWRRVLQAIALPGAIFCVAVWFTIQETKKHQKDSTSKTQTSDNNKALPVSTTAVPATHDIEKATVTIQVTAAATQAMEQSAKLKAADNTAGGLSSISCLLRNRALMTTTMAAAFNDVASFSLLAWQSMVYERVYHLEVAQYAPVLAIVLPISGIIGGVGGGLLADRLAPSGRRYWTTVVTSLMAAPMMWWSVSAHSYVVSYCALAVGFALSESWRAPTAVMARSSVRPEQISTALSVYLSIRNFVGSMGPLLVARLSQKWGLQVAMHTLAPMYVISAALFWRAERELKRANSINSSNNTSSSSLATLPDAAPSPYDHYDGRDDDSSSSGGELTASSSPSSADGVVVLHNWIPIPSSMVQSKQMIPGSFKSASGNMLLQHVIDMKVLDALHVPLLQRQTSTPY